MANPAQTMPSTRALKLRGVPTNDMSKKRIMRLVLLEQADHTMVGSLVREKFCGYSGVMFLKLNDHNRSLFLGKTCGELKVSEYPFRISTTKNVSALSEFTFPAIIYLSEMETGLHSVYAKRDEMLT